MPRPECAARAAPSRRADNTPSRDLAGTLHRKFERLDEGHVQSGSSVDPRGFGTLVHAALANARLSAPDQLAPLVRRLAEQHLSVTPAEIEDAIGLVERFAGSPRARALAQAGADYREGGVPACLAAGSRRQPTRSFCAATSTGSLRTPTAAGTCSTSKPIDSMGGPPLAWPPIMKCKCWCMRWPLSDCWAPPVELTLHFLRTGQEHTFEWNAAARERVAQLVTTGIAAAKRE